MSTAADQFDDTPSPTDLQQLVYLANNVVELVETAKRELKRDREAAKASLATALSILRSREPMLMDNDLAGDFESKTRPRSLPGHCVQLI